MSDETPLDLRALADVDSPEVVREALRTFRRRLWTRYLWIGTAIVLAGTAFVVGSRPSDLREEMEAANTRAFPEQTWRFDEVSVALEEVADLGDTMGLHFVVLPDPGAGNPSVWVRGELASMQTGSYDTYVETSKVDDGLLTTTVGPLWCQPNCARGETVTLDLRALHVPPSVWKEDG
jgi:hypothetical protein